MKKTKKIVMGTAAALLVLTCAACASQSVATEKAGEGDAATPAAEGATIKTGNYSWEKWQNEYPNQYETFIRGIDDVEPGDRKVHSHAALYMNVPPTNYGGPFEVDTHGTSCIGCKSTTGTKLYEEMGIQAFGQDWETYAGDKVDWYDCGLCHVDGEPGGELAPGAMTATAFGAPLFEHVTSEEAVCGQCHNYIGATYGRGGLMEKMKSGEVDPESVNPWRYGFDPESLMKAALEDGYELIINENTGIANFQANHPEVEIFQGSVHQELGMTCVDCHGVKMTAEDGEEFTSHGFSESPLENPEALEYCLTCHEAQGVEDADAMKEFVAAAQQKMADAEATYYEKRDKLQELITAAKDGDTDEEALNTAKENFTKAAWFVRYADGGGDFDGMKIAHNPQGEIDYVERACVLMDEGIELLS